MWLLLFGLLGLMQVEGAIECPAPGAVVAALGRLGAGASPNDERVALASADDQLRVRLLDRAGRVLHEWRLPRAGSCQELADAAALVVAVWSGGIDGGRRSLAPSLPEAAPPVALTRARAAPARSRLGYEVAASLLVGWEPGAAVAVGGAADVTLGPRRSRFAARLGVSAQALQHHALVVGQVVWTRPALSLGGSVRLERSGVRFEASVDVLAALLQLGAEGVPSARQAYDFDAGLDAGVRLGYHWRWVTPFVEMRLVGWLRSQTALVSGLGSGYQLPRLDLWTSAGLAIGP
jgi:hypothetical protein